MATFRINTKYWESLSEKEQLFFRYYAVDVGVKRCKRIISLANRVFRNWESIRELSEFKVKTTKNNNWVILKGGKVIGMIYKDKEGVEIIRILHNDKLTMAWHNRLGERNPKSTLVADYGVKYELLSVTTNESNYIDIPPISVCV